MITAKIYFNGMDKDIKNIEKEKHYVSGVIHVILSQEYAIFFLAVVLGVTSDILFKISIFHNPIYQYIGFGFIILGTIIIYWSQHTTKVMGKTITENRDINFFLKGPYRYTRNPTNFGLTIAIIGLGFLINSLFSIIFILITYIISKLTFIKKQDSVLEERYGDVFLDYRKKVRDWL